MKHLFRLLFALAVPACASPSSDAPAVEPPAEETASHDGSHSDGTDGDARAGAVEVLEASTRLDLELRTAVGIGFLRKKATLSLREEETVRLTTPEGGGDDVRHLEYVTCRRTRTAPLVGRKVKDCRVHGKRYVVGSGAGEVTVSDPRGVAASEKEARRVRQSWHVLGTRAPLADLLDPSAVKPGDALAVAPPLAKRVLGLPLDELAVNDLVLTVVDAPTEGPIALRATARLDGRTELGEGEVTLGAELTGGLSVDRTTLRLITLSMNGEVEARQTKHEGLLEMSDGRGPLSIVRSIRSSAR